jgi:hypothetical protein
LTRVDASHAESRTANYKTVFVGHANPEDNYFSAWLASKLGLMGYDVWCDVEKLRGGEDFWQEVTNKIREQSAKYLFVTSECSIKKDGTLKELAVADKIKDRGDFIIPLKIDVISYDEFPPEIIRKFTIDFSNNTWDCGLSQLSEKLQRDSVPKNEGTANIAILPFWYKALDIDHLKPVDRSERYLSNWFEVELPSKIYAHVPDYLHSYDIQSVPFPIIPDKGYLLSFASKDTLREFITIRESQEVDTNLFLTSHEFKWEKNNQITRETNKKAVRLMNDAFARFLLSKGLKKYKLSGSNFAYYFPLDYPRIADLKRYGRRRVSLFGKSGDTNWHYAIEATGFLYPLPAYFISHHVIFTKNNSPIPYPRRQHSLRRSLTKDWYNRKWRDTLLIAMLSLAEKDSDILILPVCQNNVLKVHTYPIDFISQIGYVEPQKLEQKNE